MIVQTALSSGRNLVLLDGSCLTVVDCRSGNLRALLRWDYYLDAPSGRKDTPIQTACCQGMKVIISQCLIQVHIHEIIQLQELGQQHRECLCRFRGSMGNCWNLWITASSCPGGSCGGTKQGRNCWKLANGVDKSDPWNTGTSGSLVLAAIGDSQKSYALRIIWWLRFPTIKVMFNSVETEWVPQAYFYRCLRVGLAICGEKLPGSPSYLLRQLMVNAYSLLAILGIEPCITIIDRLEDTEQFH